MATTRLKVRNDLVKKSGGGETAIFVLYTYQGKGKYFNTGKKINPAFWDAENQRVKRAYRGYTTLNDFIQGKQREIDEIIIDAQKRKIEPTFEYVEARYLLLSAVALPVAAKDFFQLYGDFIEANRSKLATATLRAHSNTLRHLKDFEAHSKRKLTLEGITLDFHSKFTAFLIERALAPNSVGEVVKNLKVVLGKLTEEEININLAFRHRNFSKPSCPVELTALTQPELDTLFNANLSQHSRLAKVRDLFCFGCTTGLRFSDIGNLKPENIRTDAIDFITKKTKDRLTVPLIPYARAILAKYEGRLPRVMSNQKMNEYLKELCQLCGIDEPVQKVSYLGSTRIETKAPKYEMVSTHTARRTFITLALERGTRPEVVMRITGHKDIKTMLKYVRLTDTVTHAEFLRPFAEPKTL